jgi:hypothetical protein
MPLTAAERYSLRMKIRSARGFALTELVEQLAKDKPIASDVLDEVLRAVQQGKHINAEPLAKLVGDTQNIQLYDAAKTQLHNDLSAMVQLHRRAFPRPEIEEQLLERLFAIAADNSNPHRRSIVETLRDHGSCEAANALRAIAYDLIPSKFVADINADAVHSKDELSGDDLVRFFKGNSLRSFIELVESAIRMIKQRHQDRGNSQPPIPTLMSNNTEGTGEGAINLVKHKERAIQYLNTDSESSLNYSRKAAEAISKFVYRRAGLEKDGRSAANMTLGELLLPLKQKKCLPDLVQVHLSTIQGLGNKGSHDQDSQTETVTSSHAKMALDHLEAVEKWFRAYLAGPSTG